MGLLQPRQLTKTLSQNHFKGIEMATKKQIIGSLDDVKSSVIYVDELPDTGLDNQMAVIANNNEYWRFESKSWIKIEPYITALK